MQFLRGYGATSLAGAFLLASCLLGGGTARAQTLYDGDAGGVPASQGWFLLGSLGGATETFDAVNKHTTLNTSLAENVFAGYSNYNVAPAPPPTFFTPTTTVNPAFPILNRSVGFTVNFTMQLVAETHSSLARAGFSILVVSSDLMGVEIGFHAADLFAQSPTFTVAESNAEGIAALTAAMTEYSLLVQGDNFVLRGNNAPLLQGTLKDYTTAVGLGTDVYRTPNLLFLGDDTSSASATTNLKFVGLAISAPEPSAGLLVITGFLGTAGHLATRRRKQ